MRGYDDGGQVAAPAYTAPPDWGASQQPTTNQADEAFLKSPEAVPPSERTPPAVPGPVGGQGLEYGAGNTGTTVIANAPPQSAAKGTTLPDDVASAAKGTTIPDDLASPDPKASLQDTLKEFPTSTDLDHAAASGAITRQQAQDAKAELIKQYGGASSDQQKAMRKQEDDAAKAEHKPQTTLPGDVAQPVGQEGQGQVNPVLKWLGDVTGISALGQTTGKALDTTFQAFGLGGPSFDSAKEYLTKLNNLVDGNGKKLLSDEDYQAKLAKINEAQELYQKGASQTTLGPSAKGDPQAQAKQLMVDTVPDFMKYGEEKALAEAQKGAEGTVKDIGGTIGWLAKSPLNSPISAINVIQKTPKEGLIPALREESNPTGEGVNFFDQTQGQRDAHMDQRAKDYQDQLDRINIPESYYHGAPKSELEAHHMEADPQHAEAVRALGDNGALLLASMGLAPVTGPIEEAAAGAVTRGLSTVVGKPLAQIGETIMGPVKAPGPKVPLATKAGKFVGNTLKGTAVNMLNPSYRDAWGKALQGDPSDLFAHHWGELLADVSWPKIIGIARKTGIVPKYFGDVITTLDRGATRDATLPEVRRWLGLEEVQPTVRGQAVPSGVPYRSTIKGNIYRGLVGLPASAGESFITGAARTALPSLIANNPQISEGDWSGFFRDTATGGAIHSFLHAPYDLQRVLRNTVFDPFVLPTGGTAKPSWGPNFYSDALTPSRAEAFNKLDPDRQNQWLHLQGWAQRNGVEAHLLPTETVGDVAQNVYGSATRPRGFSVPGDPTTGTPPKIFVGADDFDPTGGHEMGHATLDGMHPEDQKRFIYAASQVRNLDDVVNNYAHMVDPTLGKQAVKFSDLPTANEANPTHPEYNQTKVDLGNRVGLPTQDHALKEVAADTMGRFMTGGRASDYTKNPSLRRQLMMGIAAGLERWGIPSITADMNGPLGVRNGVIMGRLFDKYMTKWRQGGYTFGSPAGEIKLPGKMEQAYQQAEAAKNAPLPAPTTPPAHADIANRAYDIGQERMRTGRPGDPTSDWLQAEFQLSHPEGRPPPLGPKPSIWEPLGKAAKAAAPFYNKLPAVAALHPPRALAAPPAAPGIPQEPAPAQQPPAQKQEPAPTTTKPLKPELSHHLQAELKKQGASPGQAQAIVEGRKETAPQKTSDLSVEMKALRWDEEHPNEPSINLNDPRLKDYVPKGEEELPTKHAGNAPVEPLEQPKDGSKTSRTMRATWFGRNPDGSVDTTDEKTMGYYNAHHGAWGANLLDPKLLGVALAPSFLRANGVDVRKSPSSQGFKARVTAPNGQSKVVDIVDLGPHHIVDMTYGLGKALGLSDNSQLKVELLDNQGKTVAIQDDPGGGGGRGGGGGGGDSGGGGGGFGTYPPEVQAQLQEYAQELASRPAVQAEGYKPSPEIQAPARRGGGEGGGGGAAPAVQEIDQTPLMMGMGYGPMALGLPPGAMGMPPAAPAEMPKVAGLGALSFMPMPLGRGGKKKIGGLETEGEEEEEPSTLGNGAIANEIVAPHLAKGTMDSLKDALKAHASALSSDDPRVHKGADNMFKGEYFQPGDALHEHVLSNVPEDEQHVLRAATDAIANRSLMHVTYASAPRQGLGEETPTTKTRQIEYEMSTPQARMLKQTAAQLAGHTMVPTSIGVKLAGKKGEPHEGYVQGLSMNAAAGNHYHINKALAEAGEETPYPDVNQKFINDIEGYVSNLNAGHRGTGEGHQPSSEEYPVDVDPTHVPYRLHPREAQFLNAVINNQAARAKSAVGLRELARKGGTLLNEEGETNPIRHAIDEREAVKRQEQARANPDNPILQERANKRWSQDTLEPVIRTFKAGLVHEVHPSHEEMPEAIRPGEAFKPLGEAMQRQMPYGRPDVPMSLAFLPGAGKKGRKATELPPRPGTAPIPEGHVRLYHQTAEENADKIAQEGIKLEHARTIEGPKGIWADEGGFYGTPEGRPTVEFHVPAERWHPPRVEGDVEPKNIIGVHLPWHRIARSLESKPEQIERTLAGQNEWPQMGANDRKAVDYIKAKYGGRDIAQLPTPGGKKTPEPLSQEEHEELTGNIRKQFLSGKLKQADYLERLADVPEPGEQIGGDLHYMPMAGKRAKGFAQAEKEGRTFETPLPGGGQRFEIDDRDMEFKPPSKFAATRFATAPRNALEEKTKTSWGEPMDLEKVIRHPELFENYPGLRKTKVSVDPGISSYGYYQHPHQNEAGDMEGDRIVLKDPTDKETLAHEIQHAVQYFENFAGKGANSGEVLDALRGNPAVKAELHKEYDSTMGERGEPTRNDKLIREGWQDQRMRDMARALYQMDPGEVEARVAGRRAMHPSDEERAAWTASRNLPPYERITPKQDVFYEMAHATSEGRRAGIVAPTEIGGFYGSPESQGRADIAFLPPGGKTASEADKVKLEKPKNWDQQSEAVRQDYLEKKVAQTLARQHTGPETHPLEVLRNDQGGIKYDPNGKPVYKKHDYDIVNAPLLGEKRLGQIATQKANEHEDTLDIRQNKKGGFEGADAMHAHLKPIERRRLSALRNASAVSTMGDKIVESYMGIKDIPSIAKGSGWYSRMRRKLKQHLGEHHELFAQLLGATSAKTPVRNNFIQALDALEQFRSGAFNRHREKYLEAYKILKDGGPEALVAHMQKLGIPLYEVDTKGNRTYLKDDQTHKTAAAAMANWIDHHDIIPRQKLQPGATAGAKYNANSMAVLRALAGTWLEETGAPKTPNFAGNLTGRSLEATIDVWAARHIQRLGYEGLTGGKSWRAQSAAEPGVSALDFAFSQDAMRDAANKLTKMGIKMKPDDLQAILWFAEKHHYEGKGWTRGAGAAKSSFDDVADLAFPKTGEPMTSDDLRAHFGKIQKETATRNARIKKAKEYVGHEDPKMAAKLEPYMKQHGLTEEEVYGGEPEEEEEDNLSSWEK